MLLTAQTNDRCLQIVSALSWRKMSGFITWRPPTTSMSAASGCVILWALRWLIRCHIKNENRTSKVPYTPYTLYGCFQLHFQKTVLLVLAAKHFTAECKTGRLQSYGQPLGTQNRRTEAYTRRFFCTEPYTTKLFLQPHSGRKERV